VLVQNILKSKLADRFNFRLLNISHNNPALLRRLLLMICFVTRFLVTLLQSPDIGMIHIHTSAGRAFWDKSLFIMFGKLLGKKVLLHIHGGRLATFWNEAGTFKKSIIRKILNVCDAVIVLSAGGKTFVKQEIGSSTRVVTLPNAVESLSGQATVSGEQITFLYVGHLKPEKGLIDLLNAFIMCCNSTSRPIRLKIMGSGDTEANEKIIKEAYSESGLAGISFVGVLTGTDKWREFFSSDVFVLPSHSEDMPMTILEAMACGLPVIATTVGSIPEVIENGVNGYLVKPCDISALAEKILQMAENPPLRKAFSIANRHKVLECFSFSNYENRLEGIYCNILHK